MVHYLDTILELEIFDESMYFPSLSANEVLHDKKDFESNSVPIVKRWTKKK